jgi:autoinducer-2 kinase
MPQSAPVLTVDAGSGSARALVFGGDGELLSLAQREWTYLPAPDAPGGLDFDPGPSWELVCTCIREAIAKAGIAASDIAGVTATSMREGIVLYDGEGTELWAVPNADARAGEQAEALIAEGLAEPFYQRGGDWTSISAPARLRWVEEKQPHL